MSPYQEDGYLIKTRNRSVEFYSFDDIQEIIYQEQQDNIQDNSITYFEKRKDLDSKLSIFILIITIIILFYLFIN